MNAKLLAGVLVFLVASVCATGCLGTSAETAPYELIGTWADAGNVFGVSYDLTLVCNSDGTANLTGLISSSNSSRALNEDLTWEYDQDNTYLLTGGGTSVKASMNGDTISLTVNPQKMGIWNLDQDFDLAMDRLATFPDALVGLWNGTIEGNVSNEVMMDFLGDGTGSISVIYYQGGIEKEAKKDITWEYVKANEYQATYNSNIASLELYDDTLIIDIIPSTFIPGTSDTPITVLTKSFILPIPYIESPL
jgi:hypothetical protein